LLDLRRKRFRDRQGQRALSLFERIQSEALRNVCRNEAAHILGRNAQLSRRRRFEVVTLGQNLAESFFTDGCEFEQVRDEIAAVQRLA
jgi:hypothetical protein